MSVSSYWAFSHTKKEHVLFFYIFVLTYQVNLKFLGFKGENIFVYLITAQLF